MADNKVQTNRFGGTDLLQLRKLGEPFITLASEQSVWGFLDVSMGIPYYPFSENLAAGSNRSRGSTVLFASADVY